MVSKKISHKPICLNEYQGYVGLFGMLRFIEAAGVKGAGGFMVRFRSSCPCL